MENPHELAIAQGLRTCRVFAHWPALRLQELAASARLRRYGQRTQIAPLRSGPQELLVVVHGTVSLSTTSAVGDGFLLGTLRRGQVSGLVYLQEPPRKVLFVCHAHKGAQVIHLSSADVRRILDTDPQLWRDVALFVLRRSHLQMEQLESQAIGTPRRRLAVTLAHLAQHYGAAELGAREPRLQASQAELAQMLGLSRQTVGKEMARLRNEAVLGSQDGYSQILVQDLAGLLRIADGP